MQHQLLLHRPHRLHLLCLQLDLLQHSRHGDEADPPEACLVQLQEFSLKLLLHPEDLVSILDIELEAGGEV